MGVVWVRAAAGAVWLATGVLFVSWIIPAETYSGDPGELAPAALPLVSMGLVAVLGLIEALRGAAGMVGAARGARVDRYALGFFAGAAVSLAVALALLRSFGFIAGGTAIITGLALALGERNWLRLALVGGGVPVLLWALAFYGLRISLPGGIP